MIIIMCNSIQLDRQFFRTVPQCCTCEFMRVVSDDDDDDDDDYYYYYYYYCLWNS